MASWARVIITALWSPAEHNLLCTDGRRLLHLALANKVVDHAAGVSAAAGCECEMKYDQTGPRPPARSYFISRAGTGVLCDPQRAALEGAGALALARAAGGTSCGHTLRLAMEGVLDTGLTERARKLMSDEAYACAAHAALGRLRCSPRELLRDSTDLDVRQLTECMKAFGDGKAPELCAFCDSQAKETRAHWRHDCTDSRCALTSVWLRLSAAARVVRRLLLVRRRAARGLRRRPATMAQPPVRGVSSAYCYTLI